MRLKFLLPAKDANDVKEKLVEHIAKIELEEMGEETLEMVVTVDPSKYRAIDQIIRKDTNGQGTIEMLSMAVHSEGDEKIE